MMRLSTLALVVLAGCGDMRHSIRTLPLVVRLTQPGTEVSFERALEITRQAGYQIEFSDVTYGVFGVRARAGLRRPTDPPAMIVVQCYADGHATVRPIGAAITSARDGVRSDVAREAIELAQNLDEGADP